MTFEKLNRCIVGLQIELFCLIELLPLAAKSPKLGVDANFGQNRTFVLHIRGQISQSNLQFKFCCGILRLSVVVSQLSELHISLYQ